LCGEVRQAKLGVGYAGVQAATPESAAESATLELSAVDRAFEQIARLAGKGSADGKLRLLRELLLAATRDEQRFLTSLVIGELLLDGEAIALRPDGTPLPFQTTMRRFGRRLDVERLRRDLPLTPFLFDLLYLDGEPLLDEPEERRFAALSNVTSGGLLVPRT